MLNRQIHLTDHQQKPYNYNQYDFYEQIYKLNDSRKFILNHLIFPNFELLKQDPEYKDLALFCNYFKVIKNIPKIIIVFRIKCLIFCFEIY